MGAWENVRQLRLTASVQASDGVRHQFSTLFDYGVFDRFPTLKILVLESGGGWIGYWLDRMDGVYGHTAIGERVPLANPPSHYFRERCWISCDPDERSDPGPRRALRRRAVHVGLRLPARRPHRRSTSTTSTSWPGMFPEAGRRRFLGDNCRELFKIDV